jgi:hypothetical protein
MWMWLLVQTALLSSWRFSVLKVASLSNFKSTSTKIGAGFSLQSLQWGQWGVSPISWERNGVGMIQILCHWAIFLHWHVTALTSTDTNSLQLEWAEKEQGRKSFVDQVYRLSSMCYNISLLHCLLNP